MEATGSTFEMDESPFKNVETPHGEVMLSSDSINAMRFVEIATQMCARMPGEVLQTMVQLGGDMSSMIDELQELRKE